MGGEVVVFFHRQYLGDDLAGGKVAGEAPFGRQAEGAPYFAADLRRDADGVLCLLLDVALPVELGLLHLEPYRLDRLAVGKLEEVLDGAVGRLLFPDDLQRHQQELLVQLLAQRLGDVLHLVEAVDVPVVDPAEDLLGAEGGFDDFGKLLLRVIEDRRLRHGQAPL